MTALNKQALREAVNAANIASWGKWESYKPHKGARGYEVKVGAKAVAQHCLKVDSAFIAAANPATVLALLDELEAKDKSIGFLKDQLAQLANFNPDWDRLEAATDSLREHMAKLSAAEKRIAELESNEIREDGNQFLVVRHPGKTPVIKHCSGDLEEFLRNLIEQDPLVTIDIITHRYYGVGGQWVQDADEYLHMMAAAGIGVKGE
ncbi:ead/Ea22-like family protein [Citrobacter werkmanii]|uniref:ead/Ea22-like family protein n=1 Tax=Citrobacter TaxID=544 RepID=UPI001795226D|nr:MULTISPECIES: ead/Ea22-like family protein [Citrobacter]EFE0884434.1 ead/Ea22-like family protein [Escherichia coli]EKT1907727.1 ead/Ea22-like family protein [Escherichia coli]MBQ4926197.1 ead/Ea22-like family protein [Citrobacter werkmanii]MBQ4938497.1 ead/Ea22-like family protein [Citrobacter werkmanii]MBQ4951859.1 ead/Ea22-like family protein [Citrobacter werkmanii]